MQPLQRRGIRWPDGSCPSDSGWLPRAVGQWMGEEPGLENDPPKIYFPSDLNDNSSHPAS